MEMVWQRIKNIYHLAGAILANVLFLFPSKRMKVIAVTGTDGKTTTVNLIYHILKTAGFNPSMISSVGAYIGGKQFNLEFHRTTPAAWRMQKLINAAKKTHSQYLVLEVTSHALDQNRVWGIPFEIGVLTNVTNEHLDYHKTYEKYLRTKEKLLQDAKIGIVNRDDKSYKYLKNGKSYITYGFSKEAQTNPLNFSFDSKTLIGDFNKYNSLAAIATCRELGIPDKIILKAINTFKMPTGRLSFVYRKDFAVVIDFAHTPNSFEQVLSTLRPIVKKRIIHVFGSAGERDVFKRPFLGEISSQYCDILILTAEDPREEDVNKIIAEIEVGIKKDKCEVIKIPDRKEAIQAAIQMAKKDDLVLITGKAQEASMNYGKGEESWDEFAIVEQAL